MASFCVDGGLTHTSQSLHHCSYLIRYLVPFAQVTSEHCICLYLLVLFHLTIVATLVSTRQQQNIGCMDFAPEIQTFLMTMDCVQLCHSTILKFGLFRNLEFRD